jgi:signal transduction histidine kinase
MNQVPESAGVWLSSEQLQSVRQVNLEKRLAYLQLTEEDRTRLRQIAPALQESSDEFVETFYRHLSAFEDTSEFLQDPDLVEQLKLAQQLHLESMLRAEWDKSYVERRHHVGGVHAQVGILPDIFLGAYLQYVKYSLGKLTSFHRGGLSDLMAVVLSLLKVIILDVGLTLDAYFEQATQGLRQALGLLLKANSELKQFAQLTSHDLKTPLATVANLCDETIDEFGADMPAEAKKLIEAARNRVFRMSATIDELLTSAVNIGEQQSRTEFSAHELVAEILEQLRPALLDKGIEVFVSPQLPTISGDRARLREAFYNVLSNAVKFINRRPGRITIDGERRTGECVFSFTDNGPGIPSEELVRIFAPFRRLPNHANVPGSGLGLYFTKSLVEQHGGKVWAESDSGKGSRFYIALPCPTG